MFVVAGASGKTGREVARRLLAAGQPTRVIVRKQADKQDFEARGAEAVQLQLEDAEALRRALTGAQALYALLPEDLSAPDFHAQRRRISQSLTDAVRAAAVPNVVLLSAAVAAVTEPGHALAAELASTERGLAATGCKLSVLRASYFQENVLAALPLARSAGVFPSFFASADYELSTVATRDVAELAVRCLREPQPGYISVQGPRYRVRELAALLGAALGRALHVVDVPAQAQLPALMQAGLPDDYARALVALFACYQPGRLPQPSERVWTATTKLEDILPELLTEQARS
jgi:uncharacterized protein YbjT (DUF2867 family)